MQFFGNFPRLYFNAQFLRLRKGCASGSKFVPIANFLPSWLISRQYHRRFLRIWHWAFEFSSWAGPLRPKYPWCPIDNRRICIVQAPETIFVDEQKLTRLFVFFSTWLSSEWVDMWLRQLEVESIEAVELDRMYLAALAIFWAKRASIKLLSWRNSLTSESLSMGSKRLVFASAPPVFKDSIFLPIDMQM